MNRERVRYQIRDVARFVTFYTTRLGFTLEHRQLPAFASVSLGDAQILLERSVSVGIAQAIPSEAPSR